MDNPIKILVKKDQLTLEGIKQFYVGVDEETLKLEILYDIYKILKINQSIIYVNTISKAVWLTDKLSKNKFSVFCVHGDMTQRERLEIMCNFRLGDFRILVTTDLLSRGIDIQNITLVINYDLPLNKENYIHRIGRSGRFGKKGTAINLINRSDINLMKDIEVYYDTRINELPENIENII